MNLDPAGRNPAGRPPEPLEWPPAAQRQNGFAQGRRPVSSLAGKIRGLFHFRGAEIWIPAVLFLLTAMTTLLAGAMQRGFFPGDIWAHPSFLLAGFPFSFTLLLILGAHELGHCFASRAWKVEATLPYFIPAPTLFGTFGAVIRIKSPILSRKALLDVAVAGPLAGMAVALPAVLVGLSMSEVVSLGATGGGSGGGGAAGLGLGSSLLFKGAVWVALGARGLDGSVSLHPVAFAGWCGFLVTSLNLIPAGQLDGGHIVFSLMSRWHRAISNAVGAVLVVMSYWWPGWLLWAAVVLFIGRRRHPMWDMEESIGRGRLFLGYSCMILMFLTFTWVPLYIH
jgi:membrane-associated protease RseP (regulator of RpoE activity)